MLGKLVLACLAVRHTPSWQTNAARTTCQVPLGACGRRRVVAASVVSVAAKPSLGLARQTSTSPLVRPIVNAVDGHTVKEVGLPTPSDASAAAVRQVRPSTVAATVPDELGAAASRQTVARRATSAAP